jgi:hypothetical protein
VESHIHLRFQRRRSRCTKIIVLRVNVKSASRYVVEFDGKDDPLHPQNWPLKRKYVELLPAMLPRC